MTRRPQAHLAEVFGFPSDVRDADVELLRSQCLCPFRPLRPDARRDLSLPHQQVPFAEQFGRCTKNSVKEPLGVCSVYAGGQPAITCPVRFAEGGVMIGAAKDWMSAALGVNVEDILAIPEIRLVPSLAGEEPPGMPTSNAASSAGSVGDENSAGDASSAIVPDSRDASAGNMDYVLAGIHSAQPGSRVPADYYLTRYAALEVQAVYISGNVSNPFLEFMRGVPWDGRNPPRPDWLSSSRKRLVPQLAWKGSVLHSWGVPVIVCVQQAFWQTMPYLSAVTGGAEAFQEMGWIIVDLERRGRVYRLVHAETLSSEFEAALTAATRAPAGSSRLVERAIVGKAIVLLTGRKPRADNPGAGKRGRKPG